MPRDTSKRSTTERSPSQGRQVLEGDPRGTGRPGAERPHGLAPAAHPGAAALTAIRSTVTFNPLEVEVAMAGPRVRPFRLRRPSESSPRRHLILRMRPALLLVASR